MHHTSSAAGQAYRPQLNHQQTACAEAFKTSRCIVAFAGARAKPADCSHTQRTAPPTYKYIHTYALHSMYCNRTYAPTRMRTRSHASALTQNGIRTRNRCDFARANTIIRSLSCTLSNPNTPPHTNTRSHLIVHPLYHRFGRELARVDEIVRVLIMRQHTV